MEHMPEQYAGHQVVDLSQREIFPILAWFLQLFSVTHPTPRPHLFPNPLLIPLFSTIMQIGNVRSLPRLVLA